MTNAGPTDCHPAVFAVFLRDARKRRTMFIDVAAARLGLTCADLRSLELGSGPRVSRRTLLAVADLYVHPRRETIALAGGAACPAPEADDFLGSGARGYCVCGWLLAQHDPRDLANALGAATIAQWAGRAWPRLEEGADRLALYRQLMAESADDPDDAREEIDRRPPAARAVAVHPPAAS